jgi:hypothetical protein
MKSKSERAGELLAQLIDLVHQAAEHPAAHASLTQAALNLRDRIMQLFQESDDQANGTC